MPAFRQIHAHLLWTVQGSASLMLLPKAHSQWVGRVLLHLMKWLVWKGWAMTSVESVPSFPLSRWHLEIGRDPLLYSTLQCAAFSESDCFPGICVFKTYFQGYHVVLVLFCLFESLDCIFWGTRFAGQIHLSILRFKSPKVYISIKVIVFVLWAEPFILVSFKLLLSFPMVLHLIPSFLCSMF